MIRTVRQAYSLFWSAKHEALLLAIYTILCAVQEMYLLFDSNDAEAKSCSEAIAYFVLFGLLFCAIMCCISVNYALNKFARSIRGTKAVQTYGFVLLSAVNMLKFTALMLIFSIIGQVFVSSEIFGSFIADFILFTGVLMFILLPLITLSYRFPVVLYILYMLFCFSSFWSEPLMSLFFNNSLGYDGWLADFLGLTSPLKVAGAFAALVVLGVVISIPLAKAVYRLDAKSLQIRRFSGVR